jgi:hypothetical protein
MVGAVGPRPAGAARATRVAKMKEKNHYAVTSAEQKDAIASAVGLS